ncbi:MAG: hypothetical protein ACFCU9_06725 [Cyanophyceae cyanobacterium]
MGGIALWGIVHRLLAYARRQTFELLTGLEPLLRRTLGANITFDRLVASQADQGSRHPHPAGLPPPQVVNPALGVFQQDLH